VHLNTSKVKLFIGNYCTAIFRKQNCDKLFYIMDILGSRGTAGTYPFFWDVVLAASVIQGY